MNGTITLSMTPPPFSEKMYEQCKQSNQSRPTSGTTYVLIGFTLFCLGCEPARDSSSQNHSTWTASSMSHKASLTSKTESGPRATNPRQIYSKGALPHWRNSRCRIRNHYKQYKYTMLTYILYQHLTLCTTDATCLSFYLTRTTHPIYAIGIS
jgi:hypothetical protein